MVAMDRIVKKIKEKRELSGISDSVVLKNLSDYLRKNQISPENLSEKKEKLIVKDIRAGLRQLSGMFQKSKKSDFGRRKLLLNQNKISELLETHSSTKERAADFLKIISVIKSLNPKSVLDLGCGLNPISLAPYFPKVFYFASDIREDELSLVSEFFDKSGISGKVFTADLTDKDSVFSLPAADLVLMFKLLDSLDKKGRRNAEFLISNIKCRNILISFPTKKLSGKKMNHPERIWLEKLVIRLGFSFKVFVFDSEIFYLVEK